MTRVLAGDVGGTNTRLAVCDVNDGRVLRVAEDVQASSHYKNFKDIVREFIVSYSAEVRAVCLGLPGPVRGRRVQLTNLPWAIDADELERDLGLPTVTIINDLVANAYGLASLSSADLHVIRDGTTDPNGNVGLVSAGTGLGEAGMQRIQGEYHPFATEGGHTDFAPSNDFECSLLRYLQAKHGGHVSWERVVSGPGLASLYEFIVQQHGAGSSELADELQASPDPSAVIARYAQSERCDRAQQAMDLFLGLYGAEAGNVALKLFATGGIYLGGGIAPKLQKLLASSRFVDRFNDKGRLRSLVERIPIRIVLNDKAALQGAALVAARHAAP